MAQQPTEPREHRNHEYRENDKTDHNASETSLFEQCGYSREAIQARLERNWYEMFEGPDKIYWENDEGLGYVMDTGNHDVRTEGMSYAMMIAAMHSQEPDALDNAIRWVRLLWDTPIRTGTRRYYDNFLYAFAFLALAGEYRVW